MIPEPLHPAVVHFPVVLAMLLPLTATIAAWVGRRSPGRAWVWVVVVAAGLTGTTWFAVQTGEREEERVEHVIAESVLEQHEEAAETFLTIVGTALVFALGGLVTGRVGRYARLATIAVSLLGVAGAWRVGHTGGDLVYREGAATAYIDPPCAQCSSE